ncbi:Tyrosyl-DNA phosphodiesterase 2 [Oryzias melastigma]|uniref:Tyrosyl-DNA phosphodiesterase 2 n=1 Tax=Oryzias melastigma TaxID=30732 RepID=A0A834FIS9_ORYME|nr:tyrosyl-DNA phosphodiesterase 2 [Oryzias melastigma]KAF6734909.1 Tyrosyl-DNA phosphodiesterase 2 [Oryzias melastigma]
MEGEEEPCSSANTSQLKAPVERKEKTSVQEDDKLSLLTWNIDGLDGEEQPERARGLCSYIQEYSPDVVLLQEMIQPYVRFIHKRLATDYTFIEGGEGSYFTAMLLKKTRLTLLDSKIFPFRNSRMGRNLLFAWAMFRGQKVCLMTSHFESCKANSEERVRQFKAVIKRMSMAPDDVTVLFGGDTNLRDYEVATVEIPESICDLWERLGEPEKCRYTWDTWANTNKEMRFKARCRFDRVYLRRAEPHSMTLVGLEKLRCGRFTSDHWGIYCTFSLK